MQTILGPFDPCLESAIVEELKAHKRSRPFAHLLVLVPSTALRQHLKTLFSRRHGLSLLNVRVLTFHELALRLAAEISGKPPHQPNELFFEEVVRQLVRARKPGADAFAGIEERAGGSGALWQTLRDLWDGAVDPELALEATFAAEVAGGESGRARELLRLFASLRDFCRRRKLAGPSDFFQSASDQAPQSLFLRSFEQVFYYGFYDLTQVQLDLFHAVARSCPTTLFYPLLPARPAHDAWSFAARF
jgi:ATP-dependent helicase/nuclease subunit B